MSRDGDAVTVNVETEMDEQSVRETLHSELRTLFGQLHECQECGLVWGRRQSGAGRRWPENNVRCPDCREEHQVYEVNV